MDSLDRYASDKLAALAARSLRRELAITERASQARVRRAGRELIAFS